METNSVIFIDRLERIHEADSLSIHTLFGGIMKKTLLSILALSTISFGAMAMGNPFSGPLLVGKTKSGILVSMYGYPAQKIFSTLAIKAQKSKTSDGKNALVKEGTDISCIKKESNGETNCRLLLNSKGDIEGQADLAVNDKKLVEGFATGGGMNDYVNVTLNSQAANELMKLLTDAKKTSKRTGSLLTTTKTGIAMACVGSAEVAVTTTCRISVNANGNVSGNLLK